MNSRALPETLKSNLNIKTTSVAETENPRVTGMLIIQQSRFHKLQTHKKSLFVHHCRSPTFNTLSSTARNKASQEANRHGWKESSLQIGLPYEKSQIKNIGVV